ncbi:energy-coupling factor transporter transmembrane component T family protein [Bacillus sp. 2205SS5-2]|uniref:energy-coupling factor transporter transmembrane component T family protein n=1 Tax=Bacillus sp. 2205SS5-2 TaxID=3109031 RepID=UPI003004C027
MNLQEIQTRETWLYHINPSLKLVSIMSLFIFLLFVHDLNWIIFITLGFFLLVWIFSGFSKKLLLLLFLPFLFVFFSTSTSMMFFGKGDTTWFQWGLVHITEESFFRGVHLGVRAFVFAILGLLFALTTRPVNLFYSLMQQLHLRPQYAYSFMAGIRLIPIMIEEFFTIRNAMKVRGVVEQKGLKGVWYKVKSYTIPLLAQSIRRAHRIAVAMETKRFVGVKERTYFYKIGFSKHDSYFLIVITLIILSSYYLSITLPFFPIEDVRYTS